MRSLATGIPADDGHPAGHGWRSRSQEVAGEDYRVVVTGGAIDVAATESLRKAHRAA